MTIIASWNINSVRIRIEHLKKFIEQVKPDILLLQEIKCTNEEFPDFYSALGYKAIVNGQKGKYGVATILKNKLHFEEINLSEEIIQKESRTSFIHVKQLNLKILNVYTPNGNPIENEEKFKFKILWMEKLKEIAKKQVQNMENILIAGDFNVLENEKDVTNFKFWENDALGNINIRQKFREILSSGLTNIVRVFNRPGENFSYWDYQKSCWERNDGLLIDHFLISPSYLHHVKNITFESKYRAMERPSDHIPIWIALNI